MAKKEPKKVDEAPEEEPKPKHDPFLPEGKTIDERMADLLADHKKMGAR